MKIDNYVAENERKQTTPKNIKRLKLMSKFAILACSLMYISYIPQIMSNFSGHPVSPIQPAMATINATLWVAYGWLKTYKDWPVIISNAPGIAFGLVTFVTVYIH